MSQTLRSSGSAGAAGAETDLKADASRRETAEVSLGTALARLHHALEDGGRQASNEAVQALREAATREQRAQNAVVAVNAADLLDVLELIPGGALPPPCFDGYREQARAWCRRAPLAQRLALLRACVWSLPFNRREHFALWGGLNLDDQQLGAAPPLPAVAWERFVRGAESWVAFADTQELVAYIVEVWRALPRQEQVAVLVNVDESS